DYEHRRGWIEERILKLSTIFSIDVAAYAVMSNHYHVVLHIDRDQAQHWSDVEICTRWLELFSGQALASRFVKGEVLDSAEQQRLSDLILIWQQRLMDISWFMRCLNEYIAREANKEDEVTGRFWEGRFKSQALLDEKALIACMAYVDLNPVRAKMADTPETSDHTAIKHRIQHHQDKASQNPNQIHQQPEGLLPFIGYPRKGQPEKGLPFRYTDYLELIDWTGRILREDKRGATPEDKPDILVRLNLDAKHWAYLAQDFESPFKSLVGTAYKIRQACKETGRCWVHGIRRCADVFPET
ncbi:MAG: transposase, partial [Gammaproteobacteria bacterium]